MNDIHFKLSTECIFTYDSKKREQWVLLYLFNQLLYSIV